MTNPSVSHTLEDNAYYIAKAGPAFYLEQNDVRQIGGRSGPR